MFSDHPEKYEGQFFSPPPTIPLKVDLLTLFFANRFINTFDWATSAFGFAILFVLLERVVLGALNFPCFYSLNVLCLNGQLV
jgi:hypothetical protein